VGNPEETGPHGSPRCQCIEINVGLVEKGKRWRGMDLCGSGYGYFAGSFENTNKLSRSIKCGEILNYLENCWLFNKDCNPLFLR